MLMLPLWREKHNDVMNKIDTFEKPFDHVKTRHFMMSKKGKNLL